MRDGNTISANTPQRRQMRYEAPGWMVLFLFLFLIILIAPACRESDRVHNDYPPQGHMRLLSMDVATSTSTPENLIVNGDFSTWHAGAPGPEGFFTPKDSEISSIRRLGPRGGPGDNSADQWWYASDEGLPYTDIFHTVVSGVRQDQIYELYIHALAYYQTTVSITVFALDENMRTVGMWPHVIELTPGHSLEQKHTRYIRVNHSGSLVVAAHGNAKTDYSESVRMCWLEWRLTASTAVDEQSILVPQSP